MSKIKKMFLSGSMILNGMFFANTALADGWDISGLSDYGLPSTSIFDIVSNFLYWILAIFSMIALIGFALSGIMYLLAAGNDAMITKAKSAMVASITGVLVGLSGLVIIQAVFWALNGWTF